MNFDHQVIPESFAPPAPIPPVNRVFLVLEQNDRGVDGRGPYMPKVIFDDIQLAIEYVVSKLKWPANKPFPVADINGNTHFDGGFNIKVMPVMNALLLQRQEDIVAELARAEEQLLEASQHVAALKGVVIK